MTTNIRTRSMTYWQWESQSGRKKYWNYSDPGKNDEEARNNALENAAKDPTATGVVHRVRTETQTYEEEVWVVPEGGGKATRTDLTEDEAAAFNDPATIAAVNASQDDPGRRPRKPLA